MSRLSELKERVEPLVEGVEVNTDEEIVGDVQMTETEGMTVEEIMPLVDEIRSLDSYDEVEHVVRQALLSERHKGRLEGLEEAAEVARCYDPDGLGTLESSIRSLKDKQP